jgi:hypothetical protein
LNKKARRAFTAIFFEKWKTPAGRSGKESFPETSGQLEPAFHSIRQSGGIGQRDETAE